MIMVQKGRATLYIDRDQAARINKELGLAPSELMSQAMNVVESNEFGDMAYELKSKLLDDLIATATKDLGIAQASVEAMNKRLGDLTQKKADLDEQYAINKQGIMLSRLVYNLNSMIIAARYNIPTLLGNPRATETIDKIKEVSPLWQLEAHCKNLQADMKRYR